MSFGTILVTTNTDTLIFRNRIHDTVVFEHYPLIFKFQKRYQEEARKELEEKLSQVSQFLAKQSDAHDRLERLRSENLQNDKHNSYRKITELEAELSAIKNNRGHLGTNDLQNDQKYQKLYRDECRARERSDNNSRRVEKKLMVIIWKLLRKK